MNLATIFSDPDGVFCFTGEDGYYSTSTLYMPEGVYEIFPFWEDHWSISSDSLIYTIIADGGYEPRNSLDFGLFPDTLIYEVNSTFDNSWPRCNDTISLWLYFENSGITLASGLVHLELDDSLHYVSASMMPDSVVGQHIYWGIKFIFSIKLQEIV